MSETTGFYVLIKKDAISHDLEQQLAQNGILDLKSVKAFNTATRKEYKSIIDKSVKKLTRDVEKEKMKRKEYYQRPDIKEKRKQYNERPEVKERKKKLQSKRNKLLKALREEQPELYAKYYLSKLEEPEEIQHVSDEDATTVC